MLAAGSPDAMAPIPTMMANATVETTPATSRARLTLATSAPRAWNRRCE
jgi:hypothetical protein